MTTWEPDFSNFLSAALESVRVSQTFPALFELSLCNCKSSASVFHPANLSGRREWKRNVEASWHRIKSVLGVHFADRCSNSSLAYDTLSLGTRSLRLAEQGLLQVPFATPLPLKIVLSQCLVSPITSQNPLSIFPSTTQICVIRPCWCWV